MRGVTPAAAHRHGEAEFQPALPMRGVTRGRRRVRDHEHISTRTPHAGSDCSATSKHPEAERFQPALPMRGVTARHDAVRRDYRDFNPHSPCGE